MPRGNQYIQVQPVGGTRSSNFSQGQNSFGSGGEMQFLFTVAPGSRWCPARSHFRTRATLLARYGTGANDTRAPAVADGFTFAANPLACGLQRARFAVNGQNVADVSNGLGQVDTLAKRMQFSESYLATCGQGSLMTADFQQRLNLTSSDGDAALPPIRTSIFDLGVAVAAQIALTAATQTVVFTNAVADVTTIWSPGDIFEMRVAATDTVYAIGVVKTVTTPGTLTIASGIIADLAATAISPTYNIYRVRAAESERTNAIDLTWTPTLLGPLFSESASTDSDGWLPGGNYLVAIQPLQGYDWVRAMVESETFDETGVRINSEGTPSQTSPNAQINIEDIFFYVYTDNANVAWGPSIAFSHVAYDHKVLDLASNTSVQTLTFDVPAGATGFAIGTTSDDIGTNTDFPPSKFIARSHVECKVNQLDVQYAGYHSDANRIESNYAASTDTRRNQWLKTQLNNGLMMNLAGCESFDTWGGLEGYGQYIYHEFELGNGTIANRPQVDIRYSAAPTRARLMLITETHKVLVLRVEGGVAVSAEVQ